MVKALDVINEVSRYLRQELSSGALRQWMVRAQLESEMEPDDVGARLLSSVDALYCQFSDGHLSEQSMRQEYSKLVVSFQLQTAAIVLTYSFLRPTFGNAFGEERWGTAESSNRQQNPVSQSDRCLSPA
jgi:hypothetical protein